MIPSISTIRGFFHKYRSLTGLGVAALFAELAYAILNLSALPMYVKFTLNQGEHFGFILATFLLTEAASRPAFGALGDKIGRRPLMIAGPAVTAVTAYLTIYFHNPLYLVLLRAIDGLGSGALWPSAFATIGDIVEEENRSAAMSMLNVTYMSGLALAFLMGGAVNEYFHSYAASFYLVSILLIAAVLVMVLFLPKKIGVRHSALETFRGEALEIPTLEEATPFKLGNLLRSFREVPDMIVLACVMFLGMGLLTPIVKLYAVEHLGLTEKQFGIAVAPIAAFMGIFAVPLGRLGDKYGKCIAVCWGIFACAVAMWVLAIFRSIILAGLAGIVLGLGFTVAFPAWNALVISVTSQERRGEVLGAVGMAQGLAAILGTVLGSYIYNTDLLSFPRLGVVNYNVPFWLSAILLSIGAVMCFTWICGRHSHRDAVRGITALQRRLIVAASIVGLISMLVWIGYRYARPVPPDRVAWQWVQQLVIGRPKKASALTIRHRGPWYGAAESRKASKLYRDWRHSHQARYTVFFAESQTNGSARVPVKFSFPGNKTIYQYVDLCRPNPRSEWKVCGLSSKE
ncbi:MAG: MFS transporter [Armatimonadetes bacterium]|nr:MFS transporter [Armatimonadota bacterium]